LVAYPSHSWHIEKESFSRFPPESDRTIRQEHVRETTLTSKTLSAAKRPVQLAVNILGIPAPARTSPPTWRKWQNASLKCDDLTAIPGTLLADEP